MVRSTSIIQKTASKKAADLHVIMGLLASKGLDSTLICFCSMDGTNATSGERKGLQRRIRHTSTHSIYINDHRLALCLKHMIPRYHTLVELDGMLLSIWKLLHYCFIQQATFEQTQAMAEVQPMKIIKACTTCEACEATSRVISRFELILDVLDTIVYGKGDAEAKGIRDQLLEPSITLFLLLSAEVLAPIKIFSKYIQPSNLVYLSVTSKLNKLVSSLNEVEKSLQNQDSFDTTLKFFSKTMPILKICNQRNDLGRNIRNRQLVPGDDDHHKEMIQEFINGTACQFIDDLVAEIERKHFPKTILQLLHSTYLT